MSEIGPLRPASSARAGAAAPAQAGGTLTRRRVIDLGRVCSCACQS